MFPVQDSQRGEELGAAVVLEQGMTLGKLRRALHRELLQGEIPGRWIRVEQLPLNGVGKVDGRKIRTWLERRERSSLKID